MSVKFWNVDGQNIVYDGQVVGVLFDKEEAFECILNGMEVENKIVRLQEHVETLEKMLDELRFLRDIINER